MIDIKNKFDCCGCMACKNICPVNAISMVEDEKGFKYPNINYNLCINCGLCEKACPIINKENEKPKTISAFACTNLDDKTRMESSSGGVFTLLAEYIINAGGVVFGVAFNENFEAEHIAIEKLEDIELLRKSKYMQSNINSTYKQAKKFLKEGRQVLFTGTPCQIEGLQAYLGEEYPNLYLQDIICHGVPSNKVWRKYLKYRSTIDNDKPKKISFRDKEKNGWSNYEVLFSYKNKNITIKHTEDLFMRIFLKDIALRDSCYKCNFKKHYRMSDITLADFWGINNILPEMNDEKGTSLIIINSEKGRKLFDIIKDKICYKEVNLDEAIKYNPSMIKSPEEHPNTKEFFESLEKGENLEDLVEKYIN